MVPIPSHIIIDPHAYRTVKQRLGWSKGALRRMLPKVLVNGKPHGKLKGHKKRWVDGIHLKHQNASGFILFSRHLFIFQSRNGEPYSRLLTVYKEGWGPGN